MLGNKQLSNEKEIIANKKPNSRPILLPFLLYTMRIRNLNFEKYKKILKL